MADSELTLDEAPATRRSVVASSEEEAVAGLRDGMTIAIGGFINAAHPMGMVRQIIRAGVKDLTLVGAASSGLDVDMLIAAGAVRTLVSPYVGAEGLAPIGPAFRRPPRTVSSTCSSSTRLISTPAYAPPRSASRSIRGARGSRRHTRRSIRGFARSAIRSKTSC